MFYPQERVALLIDGVGITGVARLLDRQVDFSKLRTMFASKARLMTARYYTTVVEENDHAPLRPLLDYLGYNGYVVRTKPARSFIDAEGRRKFKGSMNIEMAIDALQMAENVDHIVIFSGDGDLCGLVEALQRQGKRVSICSSVKTQPQVASDDLRRQADNFIEFADIAKDCHREPVAA